jgi:activator of HSP90 ATPase
MPDDTETVVLHVQLQTIVKEAEDVEAQATSLLLEKEESKTTALEQTATATRQHVSSSSSSSSSPAMVTASLTYEDTIIVELHL